MKESQSLTTYFRLLRYLKGLRGIFSVSIIGYLIFASTQPMLAKLMELIVDAIETGNHDSRAILALGAIGIVIVRGIGGFLGDYYNEYVGASVVRNLKSEVFDHLTVLPASFFERSAHGDLLHQLNNGVNRVQAVVTNALKTVIKEGLTVIALLAYAFYLNWQLSLIFLLIAPILGLLVSRTNKKLKSIARKTEGATGKALQVSKELLGNYHIVRGFGAQNYEASRYTRTVDNIFKMQVKINKVSSIFTPLSQIIVAAALAFIIFLLLTPSVLANNTTGELVGYLTAVGLIPKPLRQLSRITIIIQRGIVGAELIFNILDREPEKDTGNTQKNTVAGNITVKNLTFTYPSSNKPALENVNLDIFSGQTVAIVGKSGSGKTTLANLLCRIHHPPNNTILIDDIDINQFEINNLRSHIAIVDQNISLFDDTLRNNISYGEQEFNDNDIKDACRNANALDFIDELPEGLETIIGEDGQRLSGGQRQRIAIARAFLKDAPILIMDEATSALDNNSEENISRAIASLTSGRTTIVIAHRLSTIKNADRIIVMDNGKVIESGSHSELLEANGLYETLYSSSALDTKNS